MRCRFFTSWSGSTFQGSGCSPVKVVRELGSKRRKVLRPREVICVKNLPHIGETLLFFPNKKRVTPREVGIELKIKK